MFKELLENVKLLADELSQYEDYELKVDTIEGETDFKNWLNWLYDKYSFEDVMQHSIDIRIKALQARKQSSKSRQDKFKSMMASILNALGEQKITTEEFTLSKVKGRMSVVIDDENLIPDEFVKIIRQADKKAIAEALKGGCVVGARLVQGEDTIMLRSK